MSIATAITNLQGRVESAYDKIEERGGTLPQVLNTANLPNAIDSIPQGEVDKRKFGATIDEVLQTTTTGDETTLELWGGVTSLTFNGVTNIPADGMRYAFYGKGITSVSFPVLTSASKDSFYHAFNGCTSLTNVSFPALTTVSGAFSNAFNGCTSLTTVSFTELTTASGAGVFDSAFNGCTSLTNVSFPALTTLSGYSTKIFYGCRNLTTVSFPELTALSGAMFTDAFQNCTSLTSVSFPKLQSINKTTGTWPTFGTCFVNCGITTLSFPALTSIVENASNANTSVFKGGTSLTRIDFPVLSSIKKTTSATSDDLLYLFGGCTNLVEIHFGAENQAVIEASDGYATKWGAPNANCQIYFDL